MFFSLRVVDAIAIANASPALIVMRGQTNWQISRLMTHGKSEKCEVEKKNSKKMWFPWIAALCSHSRWQLCLAICSSESPISTTSSLNVGWQQKVNTAQLNLRCKFILAAGYWGSFNCIWRASLSWRKAARRLFPATGRVIVFLWAFGSLRLLWDSVTGAMVVFHRGICFDCWCGHFLETLGAAISSSHCWDLVCTWRNACTLYVAAARAVWNFQSAV